MLSPKSGGSVQRAGGMDLGGQLAVSVSGRNPGRRAASTGCSASDGHPRDSRAVGGGVGVGEGRHWTREAEVTFGGAWRRLRK